PTARREVPPLVGVPDTNGEGQRRQKNDGHDGPARASGSRASPLAYTHGGGGGGISEPTGSPASSGSLFCTTWRKWMKMLCASDIHGTAKSAPIVWKK